MARTLPEDDERRARLLAVSDSALAEEGAVRSVIAARILGLSEKTIRAWAAAGVLAVARRSPRLLLDVRSVHVVSHLVSELRAAGQDRDLLDQVWRRLEDVALLDHDLRESVERRCTAKQRTGNQASSIVDTTLSWSAPGTRARSSWQENRSF